MLLGLLLGRAGVPVLVLEKHADFLRDFRGDTVHPSTLEILAELGLLEECLRRPHQELQRLRGRIAGESLQLADFSHLPAPARFIALMPQWDFLNFLAEQARRHPSFELRMQAEVVGLLWNQGEVSGLRVQTPEGVLEVQSDLTVAADGRSSLVREQAGLSVQDFGAPMDVLWMRVSRRPSDDAQLFGYVESGRILVLIDRGDYWQCALVIPKGQFESLQREPISSLHRQIAAVVPFLSDRMAELSSWQDVKLLSVRVDRLRQWCRAGLLCIGDAAHAMSPVGGIGINLAIQDAVAAANLLVGPLRRGPPALADLRRVQRRRELPTRLMQSAQLAVQNRFIGPTLRGTASVPALARMFDRFPLLQRVPARLIGLGVRREHVSAALANPAHAAARAP
jgi:2-polyprenyl-6-methoxyphenol hydroxylase-like FAD-dependent oxidoreductase